MRSAALALCLCVLPLAATADDAHRLADKWCPLPPNDHSMVGENNARFAQVHCLFARARKETEMVAAHEQIALALKTFARWTDGLCESSMDSGAVYVDFRLWAGPAGSGGTQNLLECEIEVATGAAYLAHVLGSMPEKLTRLLSAHRKGGEEIRNVWRAYRKRAKQSSPKANPEIGKLIPETWTAFVTRMGKIEIGANKLGEQLCKAMDPTPEGCAESVALFAFSRAEPPTVIPSE